MNGTLRATLIALLFLGAVACEPPGPIDAYCEVHQECYGSYDLEDCIDQREQQEQAMIQVGEECHQAFLDFHQCMGDLPCDALFEFYDSHLWCGEEDDAWSAACYGW